MFKRLLSPPEQSRAAKTVKIYGWIIFLQGGLLLLFPDFMARVMHFGPLNPASFWIFAFDRHAGFRIRHAPCSEWTAQCGGLCIRHVDRSAIRRPDDGRAVVFWGIARSARALICDRRFPKLALDFTDVAR
jgi:hypothetical protein